MESLLNRYRNITVLLLVIMAQLVLLAFGAKIGDVPLIRVWAVTAVTPAARISIRPLKRDVGVDSRLEHAQAQGIRLMAKIEMLAIVPVGEVLNAA